MNFKNLPQGPSMSTALNLATQLASAEFWYAHSEGATFGPFTPGQMEELKQQARIGPQTMVVPAGDANWVELASLLPIQETIRTPTSAELSELLGVAAAGSSSEANSGENTQVHVTRESTQVESAQAPTMRKSSRSHVSSRLNSPRVSGCAVSEAALDLERIGETLDGMDC